MGIVSVRLLVMLSVAIAEETIKGKYLNIKSIGHVKHSLNMPKTLVPLNK